MATKAEMSMKTRGNLIAAALLDLSAGRASFTDCAGPADGAEILGRRFAGARELVDRWFLDAPQ